MIEKRNRTAEDQVRKIAFSKYDRQIFEEKTKEFYNFFSIQLRMEKLSHRVHNLRDRKFRGEPRLLVPKVSSSIWPRNSRESSKSTQLSLILQE